LNDEPDEDDPVNDHAEAWSYRQKRIVEMVKEFATVFRRSGAKAVTQTYEYISNIRSGQERNAANH
jgi:hypothetical protein